MNPHRVLPTFCTTCGNQLRQVAAGRFTCSLQHDTWLNPAPGPTVYVIEKERVLFGVRSAEPFSGKLDVPGGFLDLDETLEQAAERECKEELGIIIELLDYLGSYPSDYVGRDIINVVYVARINSGKLTPGDDMNGGKPVWRAIYDLPSKDELSWEWQLAAQVDLVRWYESNKPHLTS